MSFIVTIFAILILLIGLASMVTPIPGGTLLISIGVTLLICSSPKARYCIRYIRTRSNRFNKLFFLIEDKVGTRVKVIGNALSQTRPIQEGNKGEK